MLRAACSQLAAGWRRAYFLACIRDAPLALLAPIPMEESDCMDGVSKVARSGQIIIGLIYLVAGAIKVWEPVLFYWESIPYTQILGIGRDN